MSLRGYFYSLATDKEKGLIAGVLRIFLLILSCIYGLTVRFLISFHSLRACRLSCKVISVGNITLGGTGKTPLVEFIARYLKQQGHKVAILTRGYKRKAAEYLPASRQGEADGGIRTTEYETMGDEPYMLSKNLGDIPVIVDANRARGAAQAIREYGADTVILDDGFQQWKIKKDLEIVAISAVNPFGSRNMLPRGILREPLSSLKRADCFVLTKTEFNPNPQALKDYLSSINPQAQIVESIHSPVGFYPLDQPDRLLGTDALKGKTVTLTCGIADPDSFEAALKRLSINIGLSFRFPDHYPYQERDIEEISRKSQERKIEIVVTTEKDASRIPRLALSKGLRIFVFKIQLRIKSDEKEFLNRILRVYPG